jgi:tetratricopeptide (TPR) repeat protein
MFGKLPCIGNIGGSLTPHILRKGVKALTLLMLRILFAVDKPSFPSLDNIAMRAISLDCRANLHLLFPFMVKFPRIPTASRIEEMATSEEAQRAKTAGSNAWSAGQYALAIDNFSTAISIGGDREFMKVLYSNRSAANIKLNKLQDSLNDANKCIELDSSWAKGYVRKGDALYALRRFTDSYNAYNSGLRLSPSDASLQEKSELAMRGIRNEASARSESSSGDTEGSSKLIRYIRLGIIALGFFYLLPFLPRSITSLAYR